MQSVPELAALQKQLARIHECIALLNWDQLTYMPQGGAVHRADQVSTLAEIAHQLQAGDKMAQLLEQCEQETSGMEETSDTRRMLRLARRNYDRTAKLPAKLVADFTRHQSVSYQTWVRARETNNFQLFAPLLQKTIEYTHQMIQHLGSFEHPYDALLDLSEPGITHARLTELFSALKPALVNLVKKISLSSAANQSFPFLQGDFAVETQHKLTLEAVKEFGYDTSCGRQDLTVHPFCTTISRGDVRITTRFYNEWLTRGFYASLHEAGHALYEQGLPEKPIGSPLCNAASGGVHESQSRMWENLIGRSKPYAEHVLPLLRAYFPQSFQNISSSQLYQAVNLVTPSFIRVEADEVTYNLHIMLRVELECALLDGSLPAASLPEAWNNAMQSYLGIVPPSDTEGCLQDVHWSHGFGGFPSYTLGNIISCQLWQKMSEEMPTLNEDIEQGKFDHILHWLRTRVHCQGSRYFPEELMTHITGSTLNVQPLINYLQTKYTEIYQL